MLHAVRNSWSVWEGLASVDQYEVLFNGMNLVNMSVMIGNSGSFKGVGDT